jgi:type IV pilus assembly protein PilB
MSEPSDDPLAAQDLDAAYRGLLEDLTKMPGFRLEAAAESPAPEESACFVAVAPDYMPQAEIEPASLKRILIVDDDDDYRETLRAVLVGRGYEVYTAQDGANGLELAVYARPQLVITDLNMPRMNGYELVTSLRGRAETANVPMILFTGANNRRQLQGLHIERCLLLEKPFRNDVLFAAVADLIGNGWPSKSEERAQTAPAAAPARAPRRKRLSGPAKSAPDIVIKASEPEPEPEAAGRAAGEKPLGPAPEQRLDEASDSPLIARLNQLLARAVADGASDIHFEPQADHVAVRFRVDGALRRIAVLPAEDAPRIATRLKIMASLLITERRLPQDGQIRALVADRKVEFRVATMPSQFGEKIVLRVLSTAKLKSSIAELGLLGRDRECVERVLRMPDGLVLVTGPTGSGKTTSLYTMLNGLNKPDVNLMTAEDPVEYELPGVTQVAIRPAIGLTFEKVLRGFLRQDPDILLVGEIRDLETGEVAIKASITGHLVLSTLHTNSAPSAMTRLSQMGIAPYLVAASVRLVVAQRLVRQICEGCKRLIEPAETDLTLLTEAETKRVRKSWIGAGCEACQGAGYRGRLPLFEVMPVQSLAMRQTILENGGLDRLSKIARLEGMTPLRDAAIAAVAAGQTSLAEALPYIVGDPA